MGEGAYHRILVEQGFCKTGELNYRLAIDVWWHTEAQLEILCIHVGPKVVVKGHKAYYLRSITDAGETWARDIPPLQDYLEANKYAASLANGPPQTACPASIFLRHSSNGSRRSDISSRVWTISSIWIREVLRC